MIELPTSRVLARGIINAVSSRNIYTKYRVDHNRELQVWAPGGLTEEQRELLRNNKEVLIDFLSTPPAERGICPRGHEIEWQLSEYGDWLCACYFAPYTPAKLHEHTDTKPHAAKVSSNATNFWVGDTTKAI